MRLRHRARPLVRRRSAFSLAELLVVVGVIALLVAVLLPPLQLARRQAMQTHCAATLQQFGIALEAINSEFKFYPAWDDNGRPVRYTWVDLLIQRGYYRARMGGYCPLDERPDPISEARGEYYRVVYPRNHSRYGMDYSYGIGVPLSAGGWAWQPGYGPDDRPRRFEGADRDASRRILAADATWSCIYNLNGDALLNGTWNNPTQYDNTVAWRHLNRSANMLMQDGHIARVRFQVENSEQPVDTTKFFLWHSGESLNVGPDDQWGNYWYPNVQPPSLLSRPPQDIFPRELMPVFYTENRLWTHIMHK